MGVFGTLDSRPTLSSLPGQNIHHLATIRHDTRTGNWTMEEEPSVFVSDAFPGQVFQMIPVQSDPQQVLAPQARSLTFPSVNHPRLGFPVPHAQPNPQPKLVQKTYSQECTQQFAPPPKPRFWSQNEQERFFQEALGDRPVDTGKLLQEIESDKFLFSPLPDDVPKIFTPSSRWSSFLSPTPSTQTLTDYGASTCTIEYGLSSAELQKRERTSSSQQAREGLASKRFKTDDGLLTTSQRADNGMDEESGAIWMKTISESSEYPIDLTSDNGDESNEVTNLVTENEFEKGEGQKPLPMNRAVHSTDHISKSLERNPAWRTHASRTVPGTNTNE
jgi:hypothetical protein